MLQLFTANLQSAQLKTNLWSTVYINHKSAFEIKIIVKQHL